MLIILTRTEVPVKISAASAVIGKIIRVTSVAVRALGFYVRISTLRTYSCNLYSVLAIGIILVFKYEGVAVYMRCEPVIEILVIRNYSVISDEDIVNLVLISIATVSRNVCVDRSGETALGANKGFYAVLDAVIIDIAGCETVK